VVLRPLSAGAVQELAGAHGADAGAVLAATAGNPFFVTERPGPRRVRGRPRGGRSYRWTWMRAPEVRTRTK
jgi:hypothetical protein